MSLKKPFTDLPGRMLELWRYLTGMYQYLGVDFTRSYYNCDNPAISAYRMAAADHFQTDSLLALSRRELEQAKAEGYLIPEADPFIVAADLCDIVKGCIFEWCLCKGDMPVDTAMERIMTNYMTPLCLNQKRTAK